MSNLTSQVPQECDERESDSSAVERVIEPKQKDLGGFSVRRALPTVGRKLIGPWIFFDHMGPAQFEAGQGIDVRPHPHIGIATVTYLFEGEILHRDSLGNEQPIRPGDINLMLTGKGIVHSERERAEVRNSDHRLHALQLWLALPEELEESDPEFIHYPGREIPAVNPGGVPVRVMMGSAYGATSPVRTFAETLYLEAELQPGQTLELPMVQERGVYVASGELNIAGETLHEHCMGVLRPQTVTLEAVKPSRVVVVGGEKLGQRFIEWNFVSSRKDRIEQAKADWKAGRFAKVPGDDKEFIPLPE